MEETTIDGRWLRQRRRELDCTQEQLADRLGCTSSMLKKIERGERTPSPLLAARIVETLGAPEVAATIPQLSVSVFVAGDPSNEWMRNRLPKQTGQGLQFRQGLNVVALDTIDVLEDALLSARSSGGLVVSARSGDVQPVEVERHIRFLLGLGQAGSLTTDRLGAALFEERFPNHQGVEVGRFLAPGGHRETVFRFRNQHDSQEDRRGVLPLLHSSLIGREHEVDGLVAICRSQPGRCIVLNGGGGVGKTRIAVEVARRMASYVTRVLFVDAITLGTTEDISSALSRACGASDATSTEELITALKASPTVVVIDNAEQLGNSFSALAKICAESQLRALITSRTPIDERDMVIRTIDPLPLPEPNANSTVLLANPAVALFLERTGVATSEVTKEELEAVAEVCRIFDGIPLGIELAASRALDERSPSALFASLSASPQLGDNQDLLPERQRTMEATVEWSLSLLSPLVRALIDVLAVIPTSFTLETATQLFSDGGLGEGQVLSSLESLLGYGLVERDTTSTDDRTRWRLLRSIRTVVLEQLNQAKVREVQNSYATQLHAWTLQTEKELYGANQGDARRALAGELEGLRWLINRGIELQPEANSSNTQTLSPESDWECAGQVVGRLQRFWIWAGLLDEASRWCSSLLDPRQPLLLANQTRAELRKAAGTLALYQGQLDTAESLLSQAVDDWQKIENHPSGLSVAFANLGVVHGMRGDMAKARSFTMLGMEQSELAGDKRGLAIAHGNLGVAERENGNFETAQFHLEQSVALHRGLGDSYLLATALLELALIADALHKNPNARSYVREATDLACIASPTTALPEAAEVAACLALRHPKRGMDGRLSARVLAAADTLRIISGASTAKSDIRLEADELLQSFLGNKTERLQREYTEHLRTEHRASLTAICRATVDVVNAVLNEQISAEVTLTERERELLRLGASGMTTGEIGSRLFLSGSTVRTHFQSIYRKLEVPNRAAAVLRASELGIL
jgi:predicted ATPase/DNA-binding CsgD family transcriptional regulator/transcriptional regulator with XRE-family HTH domain